MLLVCVMAEFPLYSQFPTRQGSCVPVLQVQTEYHFALISILIMAVAIDKGITFWHFLPEMEGMQ